MYVGRGFAGGEPLRYNCRPEVTRIVFDVTGFWQTNRSIANSRRAYPSCQLDDDAAQFQLAVHRRRTTAPGPNSRPHSAQACRSSRRL